MRDLKLYQALEIWFGGQQENQDAKYQEAEKYLRLRHTSGNGNSFGRRGYRADAVSGGTGLVREKGTGWFYP